ncbi:MAG: NUDIX hydrolase [Actinomycetota bacterium]
MDGHRKTISSQICFTSDFITLRSEKVELPGGQVHDYFTVQHPGAVAVVALDKGGRILMVRQHRQAVDDTLLELPAGKLEHDEDPWVCARRELQEETGYSCDELELLTSFYTSPGFTDERIHVFEARDLNQVAEPPGTDGGEPIWLEWLDGHHAYEAIIDGRIVDGKTIVGLSLLRLREHARTHEID